MQRFPSRFKKVFDFILDTMSMRRHIRSHTTSLSFSLSLFSHRSHPDQKPTLKEEPSPLPRDSHQHLNSRMAKYSSSSPFFHAQFRADPSKSRSSPTSWPRPPSLRLHLRFPQQTMHNCRQRWFVVCVALWAKRPPI